MEEFRGLIIDTPISSNLDRWKANLTDLKTLPMNYPGDNRTLLVSQSIPNASRRQPHVQIRQAMTQMAYQTERHKAQSDMSHDTGSGPMIDRSYSQYTLHKWERRYSAPLIKSLFLLEIVL